MKPKLVILACFAAAVSWYAMVRGRQVDEARVRELYADYMAAFDRGDDKAVCDMFDSKVTGSFRSTARSVAVNENFSKAVACSAVDDFSRKKKAIADAAHEEMFTNLEFTIKSIAIAPDERSATAEVLLEFRIGTAQKAFLDMRSEQTDRIIRRFGSAKFIQSDGVISFFH